MIDIHSHILPGIDDGARSIYDTLEMAQTAVQNGIHTMVATPHCNVPGEYDNYFGKHYEKTYLQAVKAIRKEGIPLRLLPGMEVYVTEEVPDLMVQGKIMPLNQTHYLLVEFGFAEDPQFADYMLERITAKGVTPVIAHVERYYFVQDDPSVIRQWLKKGYVIQVNKGSYQGRFGRKEQKTAYQLTDENLVSVIATDTHRPYRRTPKMDEVYADLLNDYSERYLKVLLEENPKRICMDRKVLIHKGVL